MMKILLNVVVILPIIYGKEFTSSFDQYFKFACSLKEGLFGFNGNDYSSAKRDRTYTLKCKNIARKDENDCYWTDILNKPDHMIDFNCPDGQFIGGVQSTHHNPEEDRTWSVRCCKNSEVKLTDCKKSADYVNNWRDLFSFELPDPRFITGLTSIHSLGSRHEDRKWKFYHCKALYQMKCPSGHGIYKIHSSYYNDVHDRDWTYECRKVVKSSFDYCYWTDYMDYTNGYFKTVCEVLTGIESFYNTNLKRRVWKVRCCSSKNLLLGECRKTNDINGLKGEMNYEAVGDNAIVTGLESSHNDDANDAVWKISTCRFIEQPDLSFDCGTNYGLSYIKSDFVHGHNDRFWTFKCAKLSEAGFENCHWLSKDFINKADMPMVANCPDHHVIVSGKSTYSTLHGDRKWNFQCCKPKDNTIIEKCVTTPNINFFQQPLEIALKANHVITGLESYHNDKYEDRRWRATVCQFKCCDMKI